MKPKKTWVIVANGDVARLFDLPARHAPLVPLKNHVWNAPEVNEYADSQGMSHSSIGASQRRMSPRTEPNDQALEAFARQISAKLFRALDKGDFEQLVVVASPRLMGFLRAHFDTAVQATVWLEIDKDLVRLPLDKLAKDLEPYLNP